MVLKVRVPLGLLTDAASANSLRRLCLMGGDAMSMKRLPDERLRQIRRELGSCSLEADSRPTLYDELDGHIRALQADYDRLAEAVKALPLLEGKIWSCREQSRDPWLSVCFGTEGDYQVFARSLTNTEANALAALLKLRQEMEG